MKLIPKYQIGRPLPLARSYEMPWVKEARRKQMAEDKAYQEDMNQPYYKTHSKHTKQQWKQQQAKRLQNQGEIKSHREVSPLVRSINNYIGEARYRAGDGTLLLKGKYTLPAIAVASTLPAMASAPIATATAMGSGYVGGKAVDGVSNLLTGKDWAENMQDWTGLDPVAGELTNPGVWAGGYYVPRYTTNVLRRGAETAMRTSDLQDGLDNIIQGGRTLIKDKNYERMKAIGKYIVSGKKTGDKGYYNSLAINPEAYYSGFTWIPKNLRGKSDLIDAFLYGKEIDPAFGMYRKAVGKDFGIHTDYVAENYPGKAKKIQVYSTSEANNPYDDIKVVGTEKAHGSIGTSNDQVYVDAAGHKFVRGKNGVGDDYIMEQDIWKFKPREYYKKWIENSTGKKIPLWKKALLMSGLTGVDYVGTPVITRTPWKSVKPSPKINTDAENIFLKVDQPLPKINTDAKDILLKGIDFNNLTQPVEMPLHTPHFAEQLNMALMSPTRTIKTKVK